MDSNDLVSPDQSNGSTRTEIVKNRKISLTSNETNLLEDYWRNGLQSYRSNANKKKILELTKQTSLSVKRIKNWIDNRKAKEVRQKFGSRSKAPSSLNPRKKSAYSCFMAEYISQHATSSRNQGATLRKANSEWKKVKGTPAVLKYKQDADEKNTSFAAGTSQVRQEHEKVMARRIFTEIKKMCSKLQDMDYEAFFIAVDEEQNLHSTGTPKGQQFLDEEEDLLRKFGLSVMGRNANHPAQPANRETLRCQVQELFNEKYYEGTGRRQLSYKQLAMGSLMIDGLPPGITCKRPSAYGIDALQAILRSRSSITIRTSSCANTNPDVNCPSTTDQVPDDDQTSEQEQAHGSEYDGADTSSYDNEGPSVILHDIYADLQSCPKHSEVDVHTEDEEEAGDEAADFFPVEKIIKKRQKKGKTEYLVKWQGYSAKHNQWVDAQSISNEALETYGNK